jgi:hypothetical protein
MMLAFLGDERANNATIDLREALREEEAAYVDRVAHATGAVRACELSLRAEPGGERRLAACVDNGSSDPRDRLELVVRGLDRAVDPLSPVGPPPFVVSETRVSLSGALEPGAGRRFEIALPAAVGQARAVDHELVASSQPSANAGAQARGGGP